MSNLPPDIARNLQRMRAAGFDQQTLEYAATAIGANLSPERLADIQRDEEQRQRAKLRAERQALLDLADKAEAGGYGKEGIEVARRCLAGGRTDFNLSALRAALRRLR